jgi:hypothetical protein
VVGLYARDFLGAGAVIPDGAVAGWTFTVPAGLQITGVAYHRYLYSQDANWVPEVRTADGTQLETCTPTSPTFVCSMGQPGGAGPPASFASIATMALEVDLRCALIGGTTNCSDGATQQHGLAVIYDPQVTITDNATPSITSTTGQLWATGYHSGTESVNYSAGDESGIRSATLAIDANSPSIGGQLACDFTLAVPCPNPSSGPLSINTNLLADGAHTATLAVQDSAGNPASVSHQFTVDNHGPAPPNSLTASPIVPGGSTFNVSWSNPSSVAPIDHAMVEWCPLGGSACGTPVSVSGTSTRVTVPGPGSYQIVVWLVDAAGKGGANSSAFVNVTVPTPPSQPSGGGSTGTGGQSLAGGGTTPLPPSGTTSLLRLAGTLRGGVLTVTAKLPTSDKGNVEISFRSSKRNHTLEKGRKREPVSNGRARAVFGLTRTARSGVIMVHAVYDGATRESAVLRVAHARTRHTHRRGHR